MCKTQESKDQGAEKYRVQHRRIDHTKEIYRRTFLGSADNKLGKCDHQHKSRDPMSDIKVSAARSSERAAGFVLIVNGLAQRVG